MKIIAHRGASGEFPENTLLAFEQAIIQGSDGIELDIQFHPQGEIILLHDFYLDKKTSASGLASAMDLSSLMQLKVQGSDQNLCTLEQALAVIAGRCLVNIEIKSKETNKKQLNQQLTQLLNLIERAVKQHNFTRSQFVISSFNHILLQTFHSLKPEITIAALIDHIPSDLARCAQQIDANYLNPSIDNLTEELVCDAHRKNLEVWVYTVDKQEQIELCQQLGVDALFTNFPARTRKLLSKISSL